MRRVFGPDFPPEPEWLEQSWRLAIADGGRAMFPSLIRYMAERQLHRERWVGTVTAPRVPMRLILGSEDPVAGLPTAERYRELAPEPDIVLVPGAGHYPHVERPEAVLSAFLDFHDRP